ncbi:YesL family protein [Gottfriedia acidiceleris]|uniref:YesL family protein n=1 Tax=Gottfriedia acidiceleris TaxID=371036 RepID=UPI000B4417FC|nr:YesL family protein [Gottfriedia acidiceleris]
MILGKTMGKLFTICEWIMKLAYVNLLWFLFSIGGLVIFGFFPATVALFTIVRKWIVKETDLPIWRTFLTVFLKEFKSSNKLGLVFIFSGIFLTFDVFYIRTIEGLFQLILIMALLIIAAVYLMVLLYIFPLYVHYEFKFKDYLKNAFFLSIFHFHITLLMLVSLIAILFLLLYQPGLIPFFSVVSIAWILMFCGMYSFNRIDERQGKISKV